VNRETSPQRRLPKSADYEDEVPEPAPARTTPSELLSFVFGAVRRRTLLAVTVLVAGLALTVTYYRTSAPSYLVETKILAQRQMAMPSSLRPGGGSEAPTRTAEELIRRRDNLLDIVHQAGLLESPPPPPGMIAAALSWVRARLASRPEPTVSDPAGVIVAALDKALTVASTEETISITVRWRDPAEAYRIVVGALQNFLEARQTQEITAIDETIALLQARLATLRGQLDREEAKRDDAPREAPVLLESGSAPRPASTVPASAELTRLRSLLEAKERAIRDIEDFRRRRLLDLQAQLEEKRNVYADAHPLVIGLRKEVDSLSGESAQITILRDEERQLQEQYAARLALEPRGRGEIRPSASRTIRDSRAAGMTQDDRVKDARTQYLHVLERVNAAQLELDAARAAFRHRYSVIWPAELPQTPVSPNPFKVFPAGLVLSLLLAMFAAAAPDVFSRRIFETWQAEKSLGLPVLSNVKRE
jgi:hypothetical protein